MNDNDRINGPNKSKRKSANANTPRTRGGCLSCKKLRIKCDRSKPKCEYCSHTRRNCIYPIPDFIDSQYTQILEHEPQESKLTYTKSTDLTRVRVNNRVQSYQSDFHDQYILNKATSQLGISKFELRLLDFFNNYCIYGFSYEPNDRIHLIWKNIIPPLMTQSELIRNSIYAYACLNLFPLCDDLIRARTDDDSESELKFGATNGTISFPNNKKQNLLVDSGDLLIRTANYFTNTISGKQRLVDKFQNTKNEDDYSELASEFMISSIMIFSFLATHHHKLMPLVSFDKSESDLISVCLGIRNVISTFGLIIQYSVFNRIFIFELELKIPSVKESDIPIIIRLRQDLESEYESKDLSTSISNEYNNLYQILETLQISIFKSIAYSYPVPLYRWILLLTNEYLELVYDKCPFALRLLYVFSSLSTLSKLQVYDDSNIWIDYMNWYRMFNYEHYDGWRFRMDESLYDIVFNRRFKFVKDFSNLQTFDPEVLDVVI
ncbi:hypothetical protein DFJ63DRAFT_313224 [Scheffersomyces coipomensis]|uniref:uncharacterized protein n=1 Tax=Scheffersomyces coipomensis TaxID=1788519 RepID=UPI00315CD3CD